MDTEEALWLILAAVVAIAAFITPLHAERIEIPQGGYVYENETVDISLAGAWPDYTIAWCSASNDACNPPDQVIQLQGNLHTWWSGQLTRFGDYYRWDGEWHKNENSLAFHYMRGKRPVYLNETPAGNASILIPTKMGPYRLVIARGDNPTFMINTNRSDDCHLWIWGDTDAGYNIPLSTDNFTYRVAFTSGQTFRMNPGTYRAYMQFNGNNSLQDISYHDWYLQTPYNTRIAKEVPLAYWDTGKVRAQFDQLALDMGSYYDDVIIPVEVVIGNPDISITDVQQDVDKLYVSGVTNWQENTTLKLVLDPDQYPLEKDRRWHTWLSWAHGDADQYRTFSTALDIEKRDLSVGWHHIDMTVDSDPNGSVSTYDFYVSDLYVVPTPTPEKIRVLTDGNRTIPTRIIPTRTPVITLVPTPNETATPDPFNITANVTVNATPTFDRHEITNIFDNETGNMTLPAPYISNSSPNQSRQIVTGNVTVGPVDQSQPTPTKDSNIYLPLPWWIVPISLAIAVFWRKRA